MSETESIVVLQRTNPPHGAHDLRFRPPWRSRNRGLRGRSRLSASSMPAPRRREHGRGVLCARDAGPGGLLGERELPLQAQRALVAAVAPQCIQAGDGSAGRRWRRRRCSRRRRRRARPSRKSDWPAERGETVRREGGGQARDLGDGSRRSAWRRRRWGCAARRPPSPPRTGPARCRRPGSWYRMMGSGATALATWSERSRPPRAAVVCLPK